MATSHLALVGSRDHDCQRIAEVILTLGHAGYRRLRLTAQDGDDETMSRALGLCDDRELSAAGFYAAHVGDHYIGSLITFEEGRRCGRAEARTHNEDGGPLERPAV